MSNTPQIRFAGFTDAWEQRKLSDMVERVTRKNENLESELPLTISAQYGLIDQNEFFDKRIASRDVSGYYLLKKGEFAYNKSTSSDAPWGAVKRLDRYEMGVLSTLYIVFALKEDGNIDSDFLVSYYDTDCWHKGVQAIAAEGARNHGLLNITPADYFETVLTVPSNVKEQHQIGTFFAKLDSLITLHQRECFSFDFSGESAKTAQKTISWEQRKVGEISECLDSMRVPLNANERKQMQGDIPYYGAGSIQDYINKYLFDEELVLLLEDGDAFDDFKTKSIAQYISGKSWVNNHAHILRAYGNAFFLYISLAHKDIRNVIQLAGASRKKLVQDAMLRIVIDVPSIDEQVKIGEFFKQLDSLITLHQHKPNKKGHDVLSVMPFKGNQRKPHYLCT